MDDVSVVLCGEAGQGIQTIESILAPLLQLSGYHVFSTKEYMSRIRGGSNSTEIRVSSKRVCAYVKRIDLLIPLDDAAIVHLRERITKKTLIIGDKGSIVSEHDMVDVPFSRHALDLGSAIYANIVAVGVVSSMFDVEPDQAEVFLRGFFASKDAKIIEQNVLALKLGYSIAKGEPAIANVRFGITKDKTLKEELLLNGAQSVAFGAISGGCNFMAAYPMTPSTGVFSLFCHHARELGIIAEQAEDEISAINMALGAWYAGARAMVATSGGGFALMIEGISLAGAIESPLVVSLGMRPGPATGLPTRTEQGDLDMVLYAGHGEFPRIVFAPGTVTEGYALSAKAFELADKHQVPVFILTDQYFVDTYYNTARIDVPNTPPANAFIKTDVGYRRYRMNNSGLSPRGIPGFGNGLVRVDSDEHDELGHITEDRAVRKAMVDKRLSKIDGIKADSIAPTLVGANDYSTLLVSWGSTYPVVREVMESLGRSDIAYAHFGQLYPLHAATEGILRRANKRIIIENNATCQFGRLIIQTTKVDMTHRILKYDGLPFSVEELKASILEVI
jgi:2-oxoglutarate ferredoxin oxidoreductase subunit alpha